MAFMILTSVDTILHAAYVAYLAAYNNLVKCLRNNEEGCETSIPRLISTITTAADKACYLMQYDNLQLTLSEIGAGQEITNLLQPYDIDNRAIYLSISPYSREASDGRYHSENTDVSLFIHYIRHVRLKQQLEIEFDALPPIPDAKRAVIASTVRTSHHNGHGWIGYKGQLRFDEAPVEVMIHVRLYHPTIPQQKNEVGRLGVNLAYAINHTEITQNSEKFYRSLKEGLQTEYVEIDHISIMGHEIYHLQIKASEKLLKYELAKQVMLCGNLAVAGQSFSNHILSQLQENLSYSINKYDHLKNKMYSLTNQEDISDYLETLKDHPCAKRTTQSISEIMNSATDLIDRKIKTMNTQGFVQGKICEINHSDFTQILFARPFSPIYECTSLASKNVAKTYQIEENQTLDETLITEVLNHDYNSIQLPAPVVGNKQLLRKFSLFKYVENNTEKNISKETKGWVALKAQKQVDETAHNIILHLKTSNPSPSKTSQVAAKLAVNLWYGFFNSPNNATSLQDNLLEGINTNGHTIDIDMIKAS